MTSPARAERDKAKAERQAASYAAARKTDEYKAIQEANAQSAAFVREQAQIFQRMTSIRAERRIATATQLLAGMLSAPHPPNVNLVSAAVHMADALIAKLEKTTP